MPSNDSRGSQIIYLENRRYTCQLNLLIKAESTLENFQTHSEEESKIDERIVYGATVAICI